MMSGHGLLTLYRNEQSSNNIELGIIFLKKFPSLLHPVTVTDESSGEENLLKRCRSLWHVEWNEEYNDFCD